MKLLTLIFFCLSFATTAWADCFPIRRIMDPSVTKDFNRLCKAAVSCDPACKNIEPKKLINCNASQSSNALFATDDLGKRLLHCARAFFIDSMVDLANTIIELIKTLVGSAVTGVTNIIKFMTDSDYRNSTLRRGSQMSALGTAFLTSSVRNFSREYTANFKEAVGKVGVIKAPLAALGDTLMKPFLKMVTDVIGQIVDSQISQFKCLNSGAKQEALCSLVGGFLMPPAVFFSILKNGVTAIRAVKGAEGYLTAARKTFTAVARAAKPETLTLRIAGTGTRSGVRTAEELRAADRVLPTVKPKPTPKPAPRPSPAAVEKPRGNPKGGPIDTPEEVLDVAHDVTEGVGTAANGEQLAQTAGNIGEELAEREAGRLERLRKMGSLSDDARVLEAEKALGRALTAEEKQAILDAHYIGIKDAEGNLLSAAEQRGFGTFTTADLKQKALILRRAGFSREQVRELMERGITGSYGGLETTVAEVAEATARREALLSGSAGDLVMESATSSGGRTTFKSSPALQELQTESYVAARGNMRIAYESQGDVAVEAARKAIDVSTTSGDPSLMLEAAQLFESRGGSLPKLVEANHDKLEALRLRLKSSPNNRALADEIYARETLEKRYPGLVPKKAEVPPPVKVQPTFFQKDVGTFSSPSIKQTYMTSVRTNGTQASELLNVAAKSDNPAVFNTVNETFKTFFTDTGWPRKLGSVGMEVNSLPPAQELASLKSLYQNFFQAKVTNAQGFTHTFAQEYRSRAWGGNLSNFDRMERNLLARIKELGGTP